MPGELQRLPWPQQGGPVVAWPQQGRPDSLGPLPGEMPSFCEPPSFEEAEQDHWAGGQGSAAAPGRGLPIMPSFLEGPGASGRGMPMPSFLLPRTAGDASDASDAMDAGMQQAAQWALHGSAPPGRRRSTQVGHVRACTEPVIVAMQLTCTAGCQT